MLPTPRAEPITLFPLGSVHNNLKFKAPSNIRVEPSAGVYTAAVLEYLVAELCEHAGLRAKKTRARKSGQVYKGLTAEQERTMLEGIKARITPHFLNWAIKEDKEMNT